MPTQGDSEKALLETFKRVSSRYYELLSMGDPEFRCDFLTFTYKTNSTHPIWASYEEEFTRTIVNQFNEFASCLYRLHLLEKIIGEYDDSKIQINLRAEFTHIPLHYALHKPSEISSRVKFSCIHLSHQANCAVHGDKDEIVNDKKLNFDHLKRLVSKWPSGAELIVALNSVGNQNPNFVEATQDFRNKSQHRLPPSLEMGLTNRVRRQVVNTDDFLPEIVRQNFGIESNKQVVSYGFGSAPPLKTKDMIPILLEQHEALRNLFFRYWDLVQEQDRAISALES